MQITFKIKMDIFCRKHSDSEDPISLIAGILSKTDSTKYEELLENFKLLGFNKVKDLAQATLSKASEISLGGDPLAQLYSAMQIYDIFCADRFKLTKSLYEKGHYMRTQNLCEKLHAIQPKNVNAILLWSASFYMQGEYDKSLECLQKIPEQYRDCVEVINNLAAISFKKKNYTEACDGFYLAISKKPDFVECWLNYITTLIKMNSYDTAIQALNMLTMYDSDIVKAHVLYGQLLIKLKMFDEARSKFQMAIQSEPESDASWEGLGICFSFSKTYWGAIVCYKKALEINPLSINPLVNLGYVYYQIKEFDKSIGILNIALRLMYPKTNADILQTLGHAYFHNGNKLSAAKTYALCLNEEFNNPVALHALGVIYLNHFNNPAAAEPCFKLCVTLDENNVIYYECLLNVYKQLDKEDLAFKTAIKLAEIQVSNNEYTKGISKLNYASSLCPEEYYPNWKLGLIYYELGDNQSALLRFEKALTMKPNYFLTYSNIADIYEKEDRLDDAEQFYKKALSLNPVHCDTIYNLIALKQRRGHIDDVIGLYDFMLNHCISDNFLIHKRLANCFYEELGNLKEAYNHFVKASEICDTDFEIYLSLGKLSLQLSNHDAALNYFRRVLEFNPDSIISHTYIGYIYKEWGQFIEAITEFEKVLNLQPNHPDAYSYLIQCQRHICNFINLDDMLVNKFKDIVFQQLIHNKVSSVTLQHSLLCYLEPKELKQIASTFAKQYVDKPYVQRRSGYVHDISVSNRCIRVGYIYTDCSSHPTSKLVMSTRELHDRNKFDVFCYSLSPINRFRSNNLPAYGCCIDISNLSSIEAANKINADGIHILIDVGNSTKDLQYEIFVLKPAPIQVKLLGYPGTSGASFIDYLITDEECSPPKLDYLYTEKLAYLNRTVFFGDHKLLFNDLSQRNPQNRTTNTNNSNETMGIFESKNTMSMCSIQILPNHSIKCYTRQMYNLPENSIVYCYFGKLYKINQCTLNMWITILNGVDNSVLWLLRYVKDAENNILEYVSMSDIDPARVIFSDVAPKEEHLRRIQLADIFLDTPLYNGHNSCLDALWAGTPIITLSGDTFASRMATSQLTAINCTETIAMTEDDYIRIAIKLGTHTHILDQIRQHIWQWRTTSLLFDYKSYCNQLENLYLHMWKKLF